MTEYRTIVADPPWPYSSRDAITRSIKKGGDPAIGVGDTGYEFMDMDALCAVSVPASDNAHLYLWTTNAFMVQAHELATAWGFKPKTILTWVKTHQNDVARVSMKAGYYFRGATEHCIFAVRGSLKLQITDGLPTAYLWPRLPHSVKPDAFFDLVESASPGPYLEMFGRRNRLGWDTQGDECLEHVTLDREDEA